MIHLLIGLVFGGGLGVYFGVERGKTAIRIALLRLEHENPTATFADAVRASFEVRT